MRSFPNSRQTPRKAPRLALFALEDRLTPATANPDIYSTDLGVTLVEPAPGVLVNDTPDAFVPMSPLSARLVVDVPISEGTLTFVSDGSFTFVPAPGFTGTTQFTYAASDQLGPSFESSTSAFIVVHPPEPIAVADSFTTAINTVLVVPAAGVLANDSTPSQFRPLSASLVTAPPASAGTLVLDSNGAFSFTPAAGFVGTTTFVYAAVNRGGTAETPVFNSSEQTVTITVSDAVPPVTTPPTVPSAVSPISPISPTTPTSPPTNPSIARVRLSAAGTGAGSASVVSVFNSDGTTRFTLSPFESSFVGGVRVALGDFTGDGIDDIIAGAGAGGAPRVVVFDGATGARLLDFYGYEETFRGGVHVAAGDVNGDGRAELVLGAGSIGGPRVRVLNFDLSTVADYFAYSRDFLGGVRVGAGDLDGDGLAEVVTAAGPSGGPDVRIFDGRAGSGVLKSSFSARESSYRGGLNVAVVAANGSRSGAVIVGTDSYPDFAGSALDVQGANLPDISGNRSGTAVSSSTVTADPLVQAFTSTGSLLATVRPYAEPYRSGVRVSGSRFESDGFDFAVAPAGGIPGIVKFLDLSGSSVGLVREAAPFAPNFLGSVYVGS